MYTDPRHRPLWPSLFSAAFGCAILLLSSCAHVKPPPAPETPAAKPKPRPLYEWNETAAAKAKGPVSVQIIVDDQKAHIYKGKTEIGWTTVASGIHKYPTPVGRFKVLEKTKDKHSNLYGRIYDQNGKCVCSDARVGRDDVPEGGRFEGAHMEYWMRVTSDGVGMHVGPIPNPGHRASHGCIRLPRGAAEHLFSTVSVGTPVTIIGDYEPPPVFKTKEKKKEGESKDKKEGKEPEAETKKAEPAPAPPTTEPPPAAIPAEKPAAQQ